MTFLFWPRRSPKPVRLGRCCRPQVEALEQRLLLSFTPAPDVAAGTNPVSGAVADFNGDGKQDLAVVNLSARSVSIRLGDGHGGFAPVPDVDVGTNPHSVAVGDFNRDGHPDLAVANLAVANLDKYTVSVRLGD